MKNTRETQTMADSRKKRENMMQVRIVMFIIVFALMIAVIFALLDGLEMTRAEESKTPEPSQTAEVQEGTSSGVQESLPNPIIISSPDPSDAPGPTAEPEPSPVPEPEPETVSSPEPVQEEESEGEEAAEPEISGVRIGEGSFRSDTGISLNIAADWAAVSLPDGKVEVTVSVSLESRMLHTISQPLKISLGTLSGTIQAPAVDYDERELLITPMGSKTFTIDLAQGESTTLPVEVEWEFRGSYSGKEFPTLSCGGEITLER